ncbi:hypothetical protein MTR_1g009990 [Medicago truncatula]|uniref:Uncharacterized protein n=1 Tax=Medicago truncatula TaxID=3880 RepID=A0A072VCL9_MEDTR|nr:hypothetical protein MTR_1g009990 [Medicago truncatula]
MVTMILVKKKKVKKRSQYYHGNKKTIISIFSNHLTHITSVTNRITATNFYRGSCATHKADSSFSNDFFPYTRVKNRTHDHMSKSPITWINQSIILTLFLTS